MPKKRLWHSVVTEGNKFAETIKRMEKIVNKVSGKEIEETVDALA